MEATKALTDKLKWEGSKESRERTRETDRGHKHGRFQLMEIISRPVTFSLSFGDMKIAKQPLLASWGFSEGAAHNRFKKICQL